LKPVLNLAKSKGLKATLISNKILVGGKSYGVDQIKDLPPDLNPENDCIVQDSNIMCFFGRHTQLSNFYKSHFILNGQHYNCVEQCLQSRKAEVMGCDSIAQQILHIDDPAEQKSKARGSKATLRFRMKWLLQK
jgi:hypothetical protein